MAVDLAVSCQISTSSGWLELNDHETYELSATSTRQSTSTTYTRLEVTSPILPGSYLVHLTPGMVNETLAFYITAGSTAGTQAAFEALLAAFEQWTYQIKWTYAGGGVAPGSDYVETWDCNATTAATIDQSQVNAINLRASASFAVPRFPTITVGA